jgi:hypothetical protein
MPSASAAEPLFTIESKESCGFSYRIQPHSHRPLNRWNATFLQPKPTSRIGRAVNILLLATIVSSVESLEVSVIWIDVKPITR